MNQNVKCTVAQIIDAQNGYGAAAVYPLRDDMKVLGNARTVWTAAGNVGYFDELLARIRPGDVVVIDAQGETNAASFETEHIGDLKAAGAAGVVVFGSVTTHSDDAFPLFAKSVHPHIGSRDGQYYIGRPVAVDGAPVCEGDLVYGTGDGIAFVEQENVSEVLNLMKGNA